MFLGIPLYLGAGLVWGRQAGFADGMGVQMPQYAYLYFRLLEYVRDAPPQFGTEAQLAGWVEDQTMLNFLAYRAQSLD